MWDVQRRIMEYILPKNLHHHSNFLSGSSPTSQNAVTSQSAGMLDWCTHSHSDFTIPSCLFNSLAWRVWIGYKDNLTLPFHFCPTIRPFVVTLWKCKSRFDSHNSQLCRFLAITRLLFSLSNLSVYFTISHKGFVCLIQIYHNLYSLCIINSLFNKRQLTNQ